MLALSLALLFHTLLLSGIPEPFEDRLAAHRQSLRFELVTAGANPSSPASGQKAVPDQKPDPIPRFQVPLNPNPAPQPEMITTHQPTIRTAPRPQPDNPPAQQAAPAESAARPAAAAPDSQQPGRQEVAPRDDRVTRITQSPIETDPYVIKLASHLAIQLEGLRVPAISRLSGPVAMEVELQLLGNGALTRARVLKSTGVDSIDKAAYRAALAASPYPEPPEGASGQNRYDVELLFTPERL